MAQTYLTLDNELIDVGALAPVEAAHLARARRAYDENIGWCEFGRLVATAENPLVRENARVTRAVMDHPMWKAVRDLEDRLGLRQGELLDEGEPWQDDPFADEWATPADVAAEKGVTVAAVYAAVERGQLIESHDAPMRVSRRSVDRWVVNPVRQRAGRREVVLA